MTRRQTFTSILLGAVALAVAGALLAYLSLAADEVTVAALARETHFHGIAVDPGDPSRLYLATHHGFYVVDPGGKARQVSESRDDFMGFTPHPADPKILYASGHPAAGGNLGVMVSKDGGRSWSKLSDGIGGPVDFHQMDVSKADPNVIYGVHDGLQKSIDGGLSWTRVGPAPEGMVDLAAGRDPDTLYAATQQGLLKSTDGGSSWIPAYLSWVPAYILRRPVAMVQVTNDGEVYAFVVGTGLIHATEKDLHWQVASKEFGGDYVLHLAIAPGESRRLYVVTFSPETRSQALLASRDGGANWVKLGAE